MLAFRGTPDSDSTYLFETVIGGTTRLANASELRDRTGANRARVFLCGYSHVPRVVSLGVSLIVNPGSIGLPAFENDEPEPHRIETGAAVARFSIPRRIDERWHAQPMAIEYDHDGAGRRAERAGRIDWAQALRTGRLGSG